ncbi:hypothetical protein F4805DRAFT_115355 [Annulohypoxylon moriforme]|nr:hypothetical protein F4805DRAFT_115355 [Annulohypoxylon moriforme]
MDVSTEWMDGWDRPQWSIRLYNTGYGLFSIFSWSATRDARSLLVMSSIYQHSIINLFLFCPLCTIPVSFTRICILVFLFC